MLPIWANQAQDTLGSATQHKHRNYNCWHPRDGSTMGTIFEHAFGGFPLTGWHGSNSFTSFGTPVAFEAGSDRPEKWRDETRYATECLSETCLSSGTPELSSRPSSCTSSRPSSYHSGSQGSQCSQRSSHSSLPDPEPYSSGLNPGIVDYETFGHDPHIWSSSSYSIPEYSSWPPDYAPVDHSNYTIYDSISIPELPNASLTQFSFPSVETIPKAKLPHFAPNGDPFVPRYPPSVTMEPTLAWNQSELGPDDSVSSAGRSPEVRGLFRNRDGGKVSKDLKAHSLFQSKERPEKCPVVTCDYHVRGFCRKYDKQRHILTHFKGNFACSFCPNRGTTAAKTFQRADVFKRHLVSVHGAENTPAPPNRKSSSPNTTYYRGQSSTRGWSGYYGNCSNCSVVFEDPQAFYHHLDECVIAIVLGEPSVSSSDTPEKGELSRSSSGKDRAEISRASNTARNATKTGIITKKPEVIAERENLSRKRRNDLPPSWGAPTNQMKMKKRVLCTFDGTRRLWKDEMMFATDFEATNFEATIPWNRMESYTKDFDTLRMVQPEVYFNQTFFKEEGNSSAYIDVPMENYLFPNDGRLSPIKRPVNKFPDIDQALLNWVEVSENYDFQLTAASTKEEPRGSAATFGISKKPPSISWLENFRQKNSVGVGVPLQKPSDVNFNDSAVPQRPKKIKGEKSVTSHEPNQITSRLRDLDTCAPLAASKKEASEPDIKEEVNLDISSCPDIKPPNLKTQRRDCESFAPSPETDISEDVSDNESISDCSTDWNEDQKTSTPGSEVYRFLASSTDRHVLGEKNLLRPVLSPMKQALVDRIMDEFWTIINQEWASNLTKCAGETPASSSPPGSNGSLTGGTSPRIANRKHQRDDEENPPDDNNGRTPKRPNSQPERTPPKNGVKFACPYRKHDPHKYTIYKHRSCALSHWDTVARVKEHLYRRHRVPIQCKRCWQTFKMQEALDAHLTVVNICSLQIGQATEGLTADLEKKLKSRKKSSPDQTEEARWKEIYGLLFPNAVVPNPYFEPVQENGPQSPDSRDLADYEEYSRQELPRYFRSYLEDAVNNETQHLEENIRSQLVSIVQDCQARMFSAYKSRTTSKDSKPNPESAAIDACVTPPESQVSADDALDKIKTEPKTIVASAYQAPPPTPQSTLPYVPDLQEIQSRDMPSKIPAGISFSDSAYSSNGTANSQSIPIHSQTREFLQPKPPGDFYVQFPVGDDRIGGDGLHDLSFEDSYDIPLDLNDPTFDSWWDNLEPQS